jgi:MSHA biogenesis protein MshJ
VKRLWQRYAERIDALNLRERILVFSAAMLVLVALVHTLYIDTEVKKERRLASAIAQKQAEARSLQDQLTRLVTSRALDPDRAPRERLEGVRRQLAAIESQIATEERKFTAPEQMRKVIEELLAKSRAVQLKSMKSLPTASITEARAEAAGKPAAQGASQAPPAPQAPLAPERLVYRHGIEITVTGAYLDLLGYLADLERLPTQLYWSSLEIDASQYPRHTMRLVVYTLSLDRAWLNV